MFWCFPVKFWFSKDIFHPGDYIREQNQPVYILNARQICLKLFVVDSVQDMAAHLIVRVTYD